MHKRPLKYRELVERLKPYGIVVLSRRGKGSEVIFLKPDSPGSKQGPQFPVKHHGDGTEIYHQVISAILRRFNIDPVEFWER